MKIEGIILGVGAPVVCRDGKLTMCAILLSEKLGLVRVFPIPAEKRFPVWATVDCEVERSATDNRNESYKLLSFNIIRDAIQDASYKREILNACILKSGGDDPIDYMNQGKSSIAMVKLEWNDGTEFTLSRREFDCSNDSEYGWISAQSQFPVKPYMTWRSTQGKSHTTHLLGREVYETLRKNTSSPWDLFNNMKVNNPDYEHWLLLGNMKNRRNVWVGVHLHRLKNDLSGSIPLFSTITDGKPSGWPYCRQEEANVPFVGNQQLMFTTDIMNQTLNRGNTLIAH